MFKNNNTSSRSLRKSKNNNSIPKSKNNKNFTIPSSSQEEAKNQRRMSYIKRLDRTVNEYESGSSKLKTSLEDGFLSFIGFGK